MIFISENLDCINRKNACTLVPTAFLRSRKMEFELPVSFSVYPRHRKTEFKIPFSFSYYIKNGIRASVYGFGFPTTLNNKIPIVISVFRLLKSETRNPKSEVRKSENGKRKMENGKLEIRNQKSTNQKPEVRGRK